MPSPDLKQALFIQTFLAITQMCVSSERGEDWWWVWDRVIKLSSLQSQASKQPSRLHKHIKRTSLTMFCLWLSLNWHWDIKGKLLWAEAICCYAVLCPLFTHNTAVAQRWRWPGETRAHAGAGMRDMRGDISDLTSDNVAQSIRQCVQHSNSFPVCWEYFDRISLSSPVIYHNQKAREDRGV